MSLVRKPQSVGFFRDGKPAKHGKLSIEGPRNQDELVRLRQWSFHARFFSTVSWARQALKCSANERAHGILKMTNQHLQMPCLGVL